MNINIFRYEFRARRKSVLIWGGSLAALILLFFSIFPGFAGQAALVDELMKKFPPALLEAFGMSRLNMASVTGFYSIIFLFAQICLAIQAGNYGFGLVSIEEAEWTADFLLTKPASRVQILTSKLLAAFASLTLTNLVIWISTFLAIALFSDGREVNMNAVILMLLSVMIFQLFFLCVGLVISLIVKRIRSVTPYSLGLGFGAYILSAFSGIFGDVALEYITPFKQIDPAYIAEHGSFNTPLLLLNIGITVISLAASYWLYLRRDIKAAV